MLVENLLVEGGVGVFVTCVWEGEGIITRCNFLIS